MSEFDWGLLLDNMPLLGKGIWITLQVSFGSIALGVLIGTVFGLFSVSHSILLTSLTWGLVEFVRGTPLLIQILLTYFGLAALGVNIPAFWAGVLALGLNSGGYQAEIIRAGVQSIDSGQIEAARSISLSRFDTLLRILVPQAVRRVIPPLTNELITLLKSSSLLSVIGLFELTHASEVIIARTFAPFEVYTAAAVLYWIMVSILARVSRFIERRTHQY
jgi:His/Glu/Gln/Arg/opine family amino acid ABC transporter permease subunit